MNVSFANFTFRPYQITAVKEACAAFESEDAARVLLKMPTGTGKTPVMCAIIVNDDIHSALLKGKTRTILRVVFKSHLERLNEQAKRMLLLDSRVQVLKDQTEFGKIMPDADTTVQVVFQLLAEKLDINLDIDLVVHDEAHHEACNTHQEFLEIAGKFAALGATATPDRADSLLIKFDHIIEPISRKVAVNDGYVCETDVRTIVCGEKNKIPMFKSVFTKYHGDMGQTIVFCRTIKECIEVGEFIQSFGYRVFTTTNETSAEELGTALDDLANGYYQFIVNAKRLGEGVDVAGITDVCIVKTLGSYTDLNQYIGRAARPDNPKCQVWEMVNPLAGNNLDCTFVVGKPKSHLVIYKVGDELNELSFSEAA